MANPQKSVVTGVLVRHPDGRFLLAKKPDGVGPYAGMYLIPGGGVNDGEPVDEAALRELYEETGVRVKNLTRVFFDDDVTENWAGVPRHFIMLTYTADYVSGDLQPTAGDDDNLEVIAWFSRDDLRALPLGPPLVKLLARLGYILAQPPPTRHRQTPPALQSVAFAFEPILISSKTARAPRRKPGRLRRRASCCC